MQRGLLWAGYVLLVSLLILVTLEVAARWIGLGTPVLYYNAAWGGLRPLPDQHLKRLKGATVTIDENGFRSARAEEPGALRVLFLGDSVTWGGSQVDDAAVFSEIAADVLRAEGQPVYAMNAGVNATALVNHAEIFRHEVDSADVVVWLFPWGDIFRAYFSGGSLWPARFKPQFALVEVIDLVLFQYWTNMFREHGQSEELEFMPVGVPARHKGFFVNELEKRKKKNLEALRSVLTEALRRNIPIIIGITPNLAEDHLVPLGNEADALLQEVAASGAHVMDVSAALAQSGEPISALFLDSVHFSASGHRAVGGALGKLIARTARPEGAAGPVARSIQPSQPRR